VYISVRTSGKRKANFYDPDSMFQKSGNFLHQVIIVFPPYLSNSAAVERKNNCASIVALLLGTKRTWLDIYGMRSVRKLFYVERKRHMPLDQCRKGLRTVLFDTQIIAVRFVNNTVLLEQEELIELLICSIS